MDLSLSFYLDTLDSAVGVAIFVGECRDYNTLNLFMVSAVTASQAPTRVYLASLI